MRKSLTLVFFTKTLGFRLGKMTNSYMSRKIDADLLAWMRADLFRFMQ